MKNQLFSSEAVSEGHPDKVADQIADAILDSMLAQDPMTRICCEVFVTTNFVLVGGEFRTKAVVNIEQVVLDVIDTIGYNDPNLQFSSQNCKVQVLLHPQSVDIYRGVDKEELETQGAGDQGIIFGYATNETENYLPPTYAISNAILLRLKEIRQNHLELMPYLKPDAKSQVTIKFDSDGKPAYIDTIIVSTHHTEFVNENNAPDLNVEEREKSMLDTILSDIRKNVLPTAVPADLLNENTRLLVNPTGKFVIGGPTADAGLTNRKIIVDTYGGVCPHGGGGMSGKDASKVDRSAAYMARYVAKNMVAAGLADRVLIQLGYSIGVDKPVNLFLNTYGTAHVKSSDAEIANILLQNIDFTPYGIQTILDLHEPKYFATAAYGHMSRPAVKKAGHYWNGGIPEDTSNDIHFFSWEALNLVDKLKNVFNPYL